MSDLKSFAEYLKTKRLRDLSIEYLRIIKSMDIPLVRLVYERNVYPGLTEEKSIEMTMKGLDKFLTSVVNETMLEQVRDGLKKWEEDKMPVPGISKHDILPNDLVLIYAAQKRALFKFIPDYTQDASITIAIIIDLEAFYMQALSDATQMIFKIQKEIEQKLKESEVELARSNKELEQFAYVASHDLQEPLRTVSSYVQLLASRYKDKLDDDANEFIDFAIDGSNRMRQLINSLLEYSRINRVKPFEDIYLSDIISNLLVDLGEQVNSTEAVIKYDNLPEIIYGDNVLIGQLFQNLIANALKFRNTIKKSIIEISCEQKGSQYLFSVKDNGIGIQKEYWDKIFVIFQRLNSREKYPGTGMGLSICKKIVERHGGKIWVESEPGIGSTFYFTINKADIKHEPVTIGENAKEDRHIIN